jgi:hypothetical protein
MALAEKLERLHQIVGHCQFANRCGLSARDDETIETFQMLRQPHFDRFHLQPLEHRDMFGKIALKGEDSYFHFEGSKLSAIGG